MSGYYAQDGTAITFDEFARTWTDDQKRVAENNLTVDGDTVHLSTVWLGIDHNRSGAGAPVIFETMIFVDSNPEHAHHFWCARYSTRAQAEAGHAKVLKELRDGRWPA